MGLGNLLYLGCWVLEGDDVKRRRWLTRTATMLGWADFFPVMVRELTVPRSDVPFFANRVTPWQREPTPGWYQSPVLDRFIDDYLLPESGLATAEAMDPHTLVVNVRRGDYFSNDTYRQQLGFDSEAYVRAAVDASVSTEGVPEQILVITDGPQWAQERLGFLGDIAPVVWPQGDRSAATDLTAIVTARRLVISNSTFSYWGGYLGDRLFGEREVVAPAFYIRDNEGWHRSHHLRPHWTVVEDIPGGWDSILK